VTFDADVAIAGGGPAGAAAALALARAGTRVIVIDEATFPRDKICGDLLGTEAIATLRAMGCAETYAGGTALAGAVLYGPGGRGVGDVRAPGHRAERRQQARHERMPSLGAARVVPRRVFDARLLDRACNAGATLVRARVLGVVRNAHGTIAGLRTTAGDVTARMTIGADGWRSAVGRELGNGPIPQEHRAVAIRAYTRDVTGLDDRMHFWVQARDDGYAWIFPLGDGRANVGLGFLRRESHADPLAAFERFCASPASPARRFLAGATVEAPAAWPIPLGWRGGTVAAPGALLVGDAAGLASPLSGSGIHHALRSGLGAAHAALRALDGNERAWRAYAAWLARGIGIRLRAEDAAHRVASLPERIGPWLAFAGAVPGLGTVVSRALLALG